MPFGLEESLLIIGYVQTIADSFSWRHEQLSGVAWTVTTRGGTSRSHISIRDLKIRRRRRQRGRQKGNKFNNQNNNFARASRFFLHFFAVTARLRRKNA